MRIMRQGWAAPGRRVVQMERMAGRVPSRLTLPLRHGWRASNRSREVKRGSTAAWCHQVAQILTERGTVRAAGNSCRLRHPRVRVKPGPYKSLKNRTKRLPSKIAKLTLAIENHKNVIKFHWKILTFVHDSAKCDVQDQYDSATAELRASFEVAVSYLASLPKQEWRRPKAAKLTDNRRFREFYEIRFKADSVQQRPIGYFGPNSTDFTILIWAIEKGNSLIPATWHKTAMSRMAEIKAGVASAREIDFHDGQTEKVGE